MSDAIAKLLVYGLAILLCILLTLGFVWILWKLYIFVIPSLFPTGAEALIHPSYWTFVGAWILFGFFTSAIRGSKDE